MPSLNRKHLEIALPLDPVTQLKLNQDKKQKEKLYKELEMQVAILETLLKEKFQIILRRILNERKKAEDKDRLERFSREIHESVRLNQIIANSNKSHVGPTIFADTKQEQPAKLLTEKLQLLNASLKTLNRQLDVAKELKTELETRLNALNQRVNTFEANWDVRTNGQKPGDKLNALAKVFGEDAVNHFSPHSLAAVSAMEAVFIKLNPPLTSEEDDWGPENTDQDEQRVLPWAALLKSRSDELNKLSGSKLLDEGHLERAVEFYGAKQEQLIDNKNLKQLNHNIDEINTACKIAANEIKKAENEQLKENLKPKNNVKLHIKTQMGKAS